MFLPTLWKLVARRFFRLLHSGRTEQALAFARRYTKLRPRDPAGWIYVNNAEVALGRREEGLVALESGIRQIPKSAELRWTAAESLMSLGREEEAKELLDALLERDADDPYAYAGLARLSLRKGELEVARRLAEEGARRAHRADADETALLLSVASTLLALPSTREQAEVLFMKAAGRATFNPAPHLVMAAIKKLDGDAAGADTHLSDARAGWRGGEDELLSEARIYEDAVRNALDHAARHEA